VGVTYGARSGYLRTWGCDKRNISPKPISRVGGNGVPLKAFNNNILFILLKNKGFLLLYKTYLDKRQGESFAK